MDKAMWLTLAAGALLIFIVFKISLITYRRRRFPEPHYEWEKIDLDDVNFPKEFVWGTATAAHQIEGNQHNSWTSFEDERGWSPVARHAITGAFGNQISIFYRI